MSHVIIAGCTSKGYFYKNIPWYEARTKLRTGTCTCFLLEGMNTRKFKTVRKLDNFTSKRHQHVRSSFKVTIRFGWVSWPSTGTKG